MICYEVAKHRSIHLNILSSLISLFGDEPVLDSVDTPPDCYALLQVLHVREDTRHRRYHVPVA